MDRNVPRKFLKFEGLDQNTPFGKALREQEFTFDSGLTPLNHGAFGAVPRRIQGIQKRLMEKMNAHPDIWFKESAFKYWTKSVEAAAKSFNCDPRYLVFVTNATEGVNTVLKSLDFKEGESILTTSLTYGSVSLTCKNVAASSQGVQSPMLDIMFPIVCKDDVVNQYERYIKEHPNIRIAIIDHISSPSGVVMPVKQIARLCHNYGILVFVDGAHAPGHIPVDLEDLHVDFYIGTFHKWLFTPRGCAMLYVKRAHHGWVKPLVTSGWADKTFGEQFFNCGTRDHIPFACAKYALEFCEKIGGMTRMTTYTSQLAGDAHQYLVKHFGTEKLGIPQNMEAPNIKLVLLPEIKQKNGKMDMGTFGVNLWRRTKIKTVAVLIQGRPYLRISTSIYNYMDEYKRLGDAVLQYIRELNEPFVDENTFIRL